jgi:nucleoside transporter
MRVQTRLCIMMFLQFFIWGGWFVTMGSFLASNLAASGAQIGMAYSTQSWGAILAPFIFGLLADRFFQAQRLLCVLHLAGAALLFAMARAPSFAKFYPCVLAYMILYMPTLALVNSISFRQLEDPSKQFARIRVWGTIGWIVVGLAISYAFAWDSHEAVSRGALKNTFTMCCIASLILGMYSLTLPSTPPSLRHDAKVHWGDYVGAEALKLLYNRNFLVFFLSSILICIPLAFYYQHANQFLTELHVPNPTGKQTIGQMSEVLFMLLIPVFLRRFGMKTTLLVGMFAWAARYIMFAFGNAESGLALLIVGIALHGVCYDFFFVSGQIFIDTKAGREIKSAAQGLITLATYGIGMLVGFWAAGRITDFYAMDGIHQWRSIWLVPAGFAALVFTFFALSFKNENVRYDIA